MERVFEKINLVGFVLAWVRNLIRWWMALTGAKSSASLERNRR